jgi:hypothetical protein
MRRYLVYVSSVCGLLLLSLAAAATPASAASTTLSSPVTQSYSADSSVLAGMIVRLKPHTSTTVSPLASPDIRSMLGVVVPANAAPIVLTPQAATARQVLVATAGHYGLLVSNQGGPIKSGDYLTISSLAGIGMKAGSEQPQIIGRATSDFNGTSNVIGRVPLKDNKGRTTTVAIGDITVNVQLAQNPVFQKNANSLPGFVSRLAGDSATQPAHSARIVLGIAVLVATFFVAAVVIYSGVRNGMVAIGRNPLAEISIGRGLVRTIIAGVLIFVAGMAAVYFILSL